MTQVKIFRSIPVSSLEKQINEWLSKNPEYYIHDIKLDMCGDIAVGMIIYSERTKKKEKEQTNKNDNKNDTTSNLKKFEFMF